MPFHVNLLPNGPENGHSPPCWREEGSFPGSLVLVLRCDSLFLSRRKSVRLLLSEVGTVPFVFRANILQNVAIR